MIRSNISLLSLLSILLLFACSKQPSSMIVNGTIKGFEGKRLYAKQINPISYHSNCIIDSSKVNENGEFEFKITSHSPLLLNFSKNNKQHPVHLVLQEAPEKYYYGYCALFYAPEPTMYLTESTHIEIDWTVNDLLDSFAFNYPKSDNQQKFYNFYLNEDLSKGLFEEWGEFKKMEESEAWDLIEQTMNKTLKQYGIEENNSNDKFDHYLYTEIKLGALNMFMNWYDEVNKEALKLAFASNEISTLYTNAFTIYSNKEWNHQSVEYFKMTERFITFSLNKSNHDFQKYYPPNEEKIELTKNILPSSVADIYIANLKETK